MRVFPNLDALSRAAIGEFVQICGQAIESKGRFDVALSGGSTPKMMFEMLASDEFRDSIQWPLVHVFWGDERFVPPSDAQSNEHMAQEALLSHVPIPLGQIHGMYRLGTVDDAASAYEVLVRSELGENLALDLLMLGVGPDGHTASLFPGEPAVYEMTHLVVAGLGHAGVAERITMTPPLLNKARNTMFLVAGADKAESMKRILEGSEDWDNTPAQAVARHAPNVLWFLDEPAAALLRKTARSPLPFPEKK